MAVHSDVKPDQPVDLRKKYAEERAKRLREDGLAQYRNNDDAALQHLYKDPYATGKAVRPDQPVRKNVSVLIVGAGWAGILLGAKLIKKGITDFLIVDKAGAFGGTWYWNQYPGVMCDIESLIYMPLLEETGIMPTEYYAHGPELLAHAERVATRFNLQERSLLGTEVVSMDWDDERSIWVVKTKQGDVVESTFVNIHGGHLHRAKFPGVKGIESFKGHSFHTSRWDYAYTGGDMSGGLTGLADKRVGIIGTGATAIQVIPQLGKYAKHLTVFQRTPSAVDIRGNREIEAAWYDALPQGWQQRRMENFHAWLTGVAGPEYGDDEVQDNWTWIARNYPSKGLTDIAAIRAKMLEGNDAKMNAVRARIDETVKDPETAAKLKPWYRWMCKRPCFHEDYLPTFNRDNVSLVDTDGKGVDEITEKGIRVGDKEYELDCIIYATGFYLPTDWTSPSSIQITGRNGLTLVDRWAEGHRTFLSALTGGFPNAFFTHFVQSGLPANATHWLDEMGDHIAYLVDETTKRGWKTIEPTREAEEAYSEEIRAASVGRAAFSADCTPGYYNREGKSQAKDSYSSTIAGVGNAWFKRLQAWRAEGNMMGLQHT